MDVFAVLVLIAMFVIRRKMQKESEKKRTQKTRQAAKHAATEKQRVKAPQPKSEPITFSQLLNPTEHEELGEGESHAVNTSGVTHNDYMGSLHETSTEGIDLCEPELGHERTREEEPESVYAGEIGREPLLDFSARGMYQGIVMSEILTRPVRRAGRR